MLRKCSATFSTRRKVYCARRLCCWTFLTKFLLGLAVRGSSLQARIDKLAVKVNQNRTEAINIKLIFGKITVPTHILTLIGDPARFQRRGGHPSGDPTQKSFPFHSKFWPTGSLFLFLGTHVWLKHIINWTSSYYVSSQVVSRETMPKSMLEQYLACDKPPPLDKLNPYRWAFLSQQPILQCLASLSSLQNRSSGRTARTDWNSTRMQITFSICGGQRCCNPRRRLVPKGEDWGNYDIAIKHRCMCSASQSAWIFIRNLFTFLSR